MDTNTTIAHARTRFDHAQQRRTIKEKYQAKLNFGYHGGMLRASPEMITFLNLYGDQTIVIPDLYENPITVNAQELCALMRDRFQEQMNAWLVEYQNCNQTR